MAIKLYWGSGSPFAWCVMLTLEVKGLAYESKLLEFSKGEHKAADYLRLNPRGKVPTLQDDDFVLYESLAIMMYLDRSTLLRSMKHWRGSSGRMGIRLENI